MAGNEGGRRIKNVKMENGKYRIVQHSPLNSIVKS